MQESEESIWTKYELEEKIAKILKDVEPKDYAPHFGRYVYLTAYQIAIEFCKNYKEDFDDIKKTLGGSGTGSKGDSLPRYFSNTLSRFIKEKKVEHIEATQLSKEYIYEVKFYGHNCENQEKEIIASNPDWGYDISLYRYKE